MCDATVFNGPAQHASAPVRGPNLAAAVTSPTALKLVATALKLVATARKLVATALKLVATARKLVATARKLVATALKLVAHSMCPLLQGAGNSASRRLWPE
jgi:hypothetical protein